MRRKKAKQVQCWALLPRSDNLGWQGIESRVLLGAAASWLPAAGVRLRSCSGASSPFPHFEPHHLLRTILPPRHSGGGSEFLDGENSRRDAKSSTSRLLSLNFFLQNILPPIHPQEKEQHCFHFLFDPLVFYPAAASVSIAVFLWSGRSSLQVGWHSAFLTPSWLSFMESMHIMKG